MTTAARYSAAVRELFSTAGHAGDAKGPTVDLSRGAERVVLSANLDGARVTRLAFRVFGCPHLVAAAEAFCDEFEGRAASDMAAFRASDLIEKLAIPVEKTGRILLLEDAVRALQASIAAPPR
ncbi:MAG: hypothetical protein WBM54_06900 [Woeseia sp.]